MADDKKNALKNLPAIDRLVQSPELADWNERLHPSVRVHLAQEFVETLRAGALKGVTIPETDLQVKELRRRFETFLSGGMSKVINATGVVLHTNLGRAPLGKKMLQEMASDLSGYNSLEFDLTSGLRGSRTARIEQLLSIWCRTESAVVVNNNAAATFLILQHFARGREVILSRGELVQIGGGFRVPDILAASGAKLVEVGTTNMTSLKDYESAIGLQTAMILKVHQSNFYISGHTAMPSLTAIVDLCKRKNVLCAVDLGSGCVNARSLDASEPTVSEVLRTGADLVCFSGDKLLGGPQAGIIVGEKSKVKELKTSPLYRALRLGKTELYLLEKTLMGYITQQNPPTWQLLNQTPDEIRSKADQVILHMKLTDKVKIVDSMSAVGGGTMPSVEIPTVLIQFTPKNPDAFFDQLRSQKPPIVARRDKSTVSLDLRTVFADEMVDLMRGLKTTLATAEF